MSIRTTGDAAGLLAPATTTWTAISVATSVSDALCLINCAHERTICGATSDLIVRD